MSARLDWSAIDRGRVEITLGERIDTLVARVLDGLNERCTNEVWNEHDAEVDFSAMEQVLGEFVCTGMTGR
jgi:hypothetical protein